MMPLLFVLACVQSATLDAEAGFQGGLFPDSWTRVTVTVGYEGEPLDAELRITLLRFGCEPVILKRSLRLIARARMRLGTDVFLTGMESAAEVELVAKEKTIRKASVPFNFLYRDGPRLLAVGAAPDIILGGMGKNSPINLVRLPAEFLPPGALALQALDVILIPEPIVLDAGQEDALKEWVALGGRLIFGAGRSTLLRQNPFWRGLCPLESPEVGALSVPAKDAPVALTLVRGTLRKNARATLALGGEPAVVHAREGLGDVVFVSAPFDQPGLGRVLPPATLMADLMDEPPPAPDAVKVRRSAPQVYTYDLGDLLRRLMPRDFKVRGGPLFGVLALAGLYAVLIGPVEFLRLRRKGTLRSGWKSFAVLFVLFSGGLGFWANSFSLRASREIHVQLWDPGRIHTLSTFRPSSGGIYPADFSGSLTPTAPMIPFKGAASAEAITVDLPNQVRFVVPPSAIRTSLSARIPQESEGMLSAVWAGPERRAVSVKNSSAVPLKECWLLSRDAVWPVGAIPASSELRMELSPAEPWGLWAGKILKPKKFESNWSWNSTVWDEQEPVRYGLILSCYEMLHEIKSRNGDRRVLRSRGVDLSASLKRGETFLIGSFDRDLSGIRMSSDIPVETYGWARVRVTEAAP